MEVETGQVALNAGDASLWHLFWQASPLVKFVMVGLISASVICWGIVIEKIVVINRLVRASDRFEGMFWSGQSLEDLYLALGSRQMGGMAQLFIAAMREWKRSQDSAMRAGFQGVQKRIEKVMDVQMQKEMALLEGAASVPRDRRLGRALCRAVRHRLGDHELSSRRSPISKNTNLAVVAPGIGGSLVCNRTWPSCRHTGGQSSTTNSPSDIAKIGLRLENFADEFSAIMSRQLDERA